MRCTAGTPLLVISKSHQRIARWSAAAGEKKEAPGSAVLVAKDQTSWDGAWEQCRTLARPTAPIPRLVITAAANLARVLKRYQVGRHDPSPSYKMADQANCAVRNGEDARSRHQHQDRDRECHP